MEKSGVFVLTERIDALGANFMSQIGDFFFADVNNLQLYHLTNHKYIDNIYFAPLIKFSKPTEKNLQNTKRLLGNLGVRASSAQSVILLKQDLISYFNEHYKSQFFNIVKQKAEEKKFVLPWTDNRNIICIHIRLEDTVKKDFCDCTKKGDYNGKPKHDEMIRMIETNTLRRFSNNSSNKQAHIAAHKLEKFLKQFQQEYGATKQIYIVTNSRSPPSWLTNLVTSYKTHLIHKNNENYDYDLWLLINSEILVLSKSTFSLIAGYYHQGSTVYYPYWSTIAATGLNSKFDKSGWIGYE